MNTLPKFLMLTLPIAFVACGGDETEPVVNTVSAITYNLGLAPGFVEATTGRTPVTIEFTAGLGAEILCVQEVWFTQAELEAATAAELPNTVFIPADAGTTGAPACTMTDTEALQTCVSANGCDTVCPDELVSCALVNCGPEIAALNMAVPGCYQCITANVGLPYETIIDNCLSGSIEFAYGGNFGQGILTSQEVIHSESTVLASTTNRRGITYAHVDTALGEVHAFCTHLTAGLSSVPYPVNGAYGSWEEEQAAQIAEMLAYVDEKAGDGQILLMGDFNTGPAGEGYEPEMEDNYAEIIAAGFANPYETAPDPACTFCADNPINAKASANDKPNSVMIDHLFMRGFADAASTEYERIGTESVDVENCEETVTTGYSDHFGLSAKISVSN